jgi:hypothetical protein
VLFRSFTVVTTITAARTKFALSVLAAAKMDAVEESGFGDVRITRRII